MNECIVERGVDMSHTKNFIAFTNLGSKLNLDLFGLLLLSFTRSHFIKKIEEFGLTNKCLHQNFFEKGSFTVDGNVNRNCWPHYIVKIALCFLKRPILENFSCRMSGNVVDCNLGNVTNRHSQNLSLLLEGSHNRYMT